MKELIIPIVYKGNIFNSLCEQYCEDDLPNLINIWTMWREMVILEEKLSNRKPNFPQSVSEGLVCFLTGSVKVKKTDIKGISYDAYSTYLNDFVEIKTSISSGPNSFSPKEIANNILYLKNTDIYNGDFSLFHISLSIIDNYNVNYIETFCQKQETGQRPRLDLDKITEKQLLLCFNLKDDLNKLKLDLPSLSKKEVVLNQMDLFNGWNYGFN